LEPGGRGLGLFKFNLRNLDFEGQGACSPLKNKRHDFPEKEGKELRELRDHLEELPINIESLGL
jgi:hypothetical protein